MPLSPEQRSRVVAALDASPLGDYHPALAALRSPVELHQFALNYNVNDGFGPLWDVIRHPHCDTGTALYVYWQFESVLTSEHRSGAQPSDPSFDCAPLLAEIEKRFDGASFASRSIQFDPEEYLRWNTVQRHRYSKALAAGAAPFSAALLKKTEGETLEREWLSTSDAS